MRELCGKKSYLFLSRIAYKHRFPSNNKKTTCFKMQHKFVSLDKTEALVVLKDVKVYGIVSSNFTLAIPLGYTNYYHNY